MPREMPKYIHEFKDVINKLLSTAHSGDAILASEIRSTNKTLRWSLSKTELLYELIFLKIFIEWEVFLEKSFIRYLCGYSSSKGQQVINSGNYYKSLSQAEKAMLCGQNYVMWYDPNKVILRARKYLDSSTHEKVIASNLSRLFELSNIRHRIVHGQDDAKNKFDNATRYFAGKRYSGSRPGRFLHDKAHISHVPNRWLDVFANELLGLASQII